MPYTLTRTLPDGTTKPWSMPFATMHKAAQEVAYCLSDNGLATRPDAAAFASRFEDAAPGTEMKHEPSGYVFRTERIVNRTTRKSPDAGELIDFEILTGGDVLLTVSDIEDRYGHPVRLTAAELAGIAEASAARRGQDHAGVAGLAVRLGGYPAETANRSK